MIDKDLNRLIGYREDYDPSKRIIKQEYLSHDGKEYFLSTVDLGIDHGFGDYRGVFWETMLFDKGDYSGLYTERYSNREYAERGHECIKEKFLNGKLWEEEEC